jgi:hypothetical protein
VSSATSAWDLWYEPRGQSGLRAILWIAWDPIGVSNRPAAYFEYDSYLGEIAALLRSGVGANGLTDHLLAISRDEMGMFASAAHALAAAESILAWDRAEAVKLIGSGAQT